MTRTASPRRLGFTLVELLVVVALIILLAAMVAGISQSGMFGSQRVVGGADRASTWLLIAKQRALRDRTPRGVRFLMTRDLTDPNYFRVTEAQYVEAPAAWIPNPLQENNPTGPRIAFVYTLDTANPTRIAPNGRKVFFISNDPTDITTLPSLVTTGDMLILPEFGSSFRLSGPPAAPTGNYVVAGMTLSAANAMEIPLDPALYPDLAAGHSVPGATTTGTMVTYQFTFQPQPRPLLGEPTVQMPADVIIDYRATAPRTTIGVSPISPAGEQPYFDILFTPSGRVLGNQSGVICLWVRDPNKVAHPRLNPLTGAPDDAAGFNEAGEQVLIAVYPHTGLSATHPVNPSGFGPGYDPYQYAKDGVNSGL